MSQASTEVQFQILFSKANAGDQSAISALTDFAFQALACNGDSQKTEFGLTLLKNLSNCGDKASQDALAEKIGAFAIRILGEKPKLAFKLLSLAGNLGNLDAKRNLAVSYFKGEGIKRQLDKAIGLLKECYEAGRRSVLEDMNTMAFEFLSKDDDSITLDLPKIIELLTFAAMEGHSVACENLGSLGIRIYKGGSPYPRDVLQGIAILKMVANLGNKEALNNLGVVGVEIIKTDPKVGLELLILASKLGNLDAKRNLAVCFLKGQGTERQPDKVMGLLKECYEGGQQSILEDMNGIAKGFVYGEGGIIPDLQKALELWTFAAQAGHAVALTNLALLGGWFYSGVSPCPQDIPQGIAILKMTAKLGDKRALHNLEAVGAEIIKTEPKIGFELLNLASDLGSLDAKRNLAVCFLNGTGTERDINKATSLLKACYIAGQLSVLGDLNALAIRFLSGSDGCEKDIECSIQLFIYAAKHEYQQAQNNLRILANHFLAWQKFEVDYGIQQDIPKGLRILHYLANTLQDTEANEQLTEIRALKIPVPMPKGPESGPRFTSNDFTIGPSTPETPHSPRTAEFLKRHNISISAKGVVMGGSNAVLSPEAIAQFRAERNVQKLEHFTGVLSALNQHFPTASPIQEIICAYIPNEVSPLFFQYQRALAALDKEPQLECLSMGAEETPSDSNVVKVHV